MLDDEGWVALSKLLSETLDGAMKIGEEATNRLAGEKGEGIPASLSILHFEVPPKAAK